MKNNNELRKVWITFLVYFVLYLVVCLIFKNQQFLWLLISVFSIGISIFLLVKNKFPRGKALLLPVLFAVLYMISNIFSFNVVGTFLGAGKVFLASCAVISTYKSVIGDNFKWVRREKKSGLNGKSSSLESISDIAIIMQGKKKLKKCVGRCFLRGFPSQHFSGFPLYSG